MVAMFVGAWAAGLIPLDRFGDSAAREANSPPAQEPAPVGGQPADAQVQSTPTQAAPPPAAAAPINPALVALDQLTDSVLASVRAYRTRRTEFGQGTADCAALAEALVVVEGRWINYNVQGRPRDLVLDATRAVRDRSLYAEVDSVETHFDRSGCPRLRP